MAAKLRGGLPVYSGYYLVENVNGQWYVNKWPVTASVGKKGQPKLPLGGNGTMWTVDARSLVRYPYLKFKYSPAEQGMYLVYCRIMP